MGFGKEGAKRRGNQSCALKRPIWGTNKPRQPTQPPMKTRLTLLRATAFAALACGGHAQTVTAPAAPQAPAAPPEPVPNGHSDVRLPVHVPGAAVERTLV